MERDSATLALLLPYSAIAPVAHRFSSRDDVAGDDDDREAAAVREAVGRVEMTVRAEVAAVDLPIEQVLALQPGDVLRLDARADDGVTLFAGAVPVHRALPGRSGGRRAVQVTDAAGRRAMTTDEALVKLGQSTTEAICGVLEMFAPGQITPGEVAVVARRQAPARGHPRPGGGHDGLLRRRRHRRQPLRHDRRGRPQARGGHDGHGSRRDGRRGRALRARAVGRRRGDEPDDGLRRRRDDRGARHRGRDRRCRRRAPSPRPTQAIDAYARTPHATRAAVSVCGEPCRLVQLVPNAFVVRMTRALDELGSELATPDAPGARGAAHGAADGRRAVAGRHLGARRRRAGTRAACPPPRSSASRPARSSSSTARPMSRSTCT